MAITRRQFVTRLGAIAAAMGLGQADIARLSDVFADYNPFWQGTLGKPRVVWIHGAECTGCSTSLLGLHEDVDGIAIEGTSITVGAANSLMGDPIGTVTGGAAHATFGALENDAKVVNIADLVVEIVDLEYHETVMAMGGDLAYQWLLDFQNNNAKPFVLVVEGAVQKRTNTGAWNDSGSTVPWCSIGMNDAGTTEHDMPTVVQTCATNAGCLAIISIGQCASFGGYPACKPPITAAVAGFDSKQSQTGAQSVRDFLLSFGSGSAEFAAADKVVNAPGCPPNPWWFTLTAALLIIEVQQGVALGQPGPLGILDATGKIIGGVDSSRRLTAVYPTSVHGPACPRYSSYVSGVFAAKPGDPGCLQKIGCKGPYTRSLCGLHGWNSIQPQNKTLATAADFDLATFYPAGLKYRGTHCTTAGHPCMACTERGYPDSFVPFVVR